MHTRTPRLHDCDSVHITSLGEDFQDTAFMKEELGTQKQAHTKTFKDIYKFPSKGVEALY